MIRRVMKKAIAGVLLGLGAAGIALAINAIGNVVAGDSGVGLLDAIELKTYDWRLSRTARPERARTDLALIEIDEYSLRNLQPHAGRWPWPRAVHSLLLDYLARAPARLIVYDINFAEADTRRGFDFGDSTWSGVESDRAFVDSVRGAGNVILLADATFDATTGETTGLADEGFALSGSGFLERKIVLPPFPALAGAAAGLGHNLFVLDADGPLRHVVPFVKTGEQMVPSLGVTAALRARGIAASDVRRDPKDPDRLLLGSSGMPLAWRRFRTSEGVERYQWALVNFRGPVTRDDLKTRTYPTYSFYDLEQSQEQLLQGQKPAIDPSVFQDKVVFVGTTAAGLFDVWETPFSRGRMSGIQVHAAVADDILSNRFIRPSSTIVRVASVLCTGLLIGVVATIVPAWWATVGTVVFLAAVGWVTTRLFAGGHWLNLSQPVFTASLALFGGVGYQYFVEGREKRKMKKLFGQYVSKDVYIQLVANPELARLGGQRREMTVLFSDIRGFTTITERAQPDEIVSMLNEYFTRMVDIVFRHHGTLDKFVGDMVMALFSAPLDDPDHADHAVEAALEMIAELNTLNEQWKVQGRYAGLDIGIGINTGPMIAGNIGSDAIMSYTVIGDAVNLGARLESLNKQYGTRIIISEATHQQLKRSYVVRPLGDVIVKGKTEPVAIFEVVGHHRNAALEAASDEVLG